MTVSLNVQRGKLLSYFPWCAGLRGHRSQLDTVNCSLIAVQLGEGALATFVFDSFTDVYDSSPFLCHGL
jgi:hypothetical protein